MKKNLLLYVLMMACSLPFFTSCGDDDDPTPPVNPTETTWKDGIGKYGNEGVGTLKINDATPATSKTVTIAAGSGETAKITLTNVVPEDATVEIDNVTMTKTDANYTFSTETTVNGTLITVTGTLSGIPATKDAAVVKALDIKVTRKVTSPLVGSWKLNFGENGAEVFIDVVSNDSVADMQYAQLGQQLGGMIAQKVTAVTSKFPENGIFDVSWVPVGSTEETTSPIVSLIGIQYFTIENQLFMSMDKSLLDMINMYPALGDIDLEPLLALLTDKGGYYALPINMKMEGNSASFYISKDLIAAIIPVVAPLLTSVIEDLPPAQAAIVKAMLEQLPAFIASCEKFDVGLGFSK